MSTVNETPHQATNDCAHYHCYCHNIDEPADSNSYLICFECCHVFQTEKELIDAFNKNLIEYYDGLHIEGPLASLGDEINFCPFCTHDF